MYAYEMVVEVLQGGELFVEEAAKAIHSSQSRWCTNLSRRPHGMGLWKNIRKLWSEFSFSLSSSFKLGMGSVPTFVRGVYPKE